MVGRWSGSSQPGQGGVRRAKDPHGAAGPSASLHVAGPAASSGNASRRLFLCCVKKRVFLRAEERRRGEGK